MTEKKIVPFTWIKAVKENPMPQDGEVVLAWLGDKKEPGCMRVEYDSQGWPIYYDLIPVDVWDTSREGIITHWMRIVPPVSQDLVQKKS